MVSSQRNVVQSTGALQEQQELSQQSSAAAGTQIVLRLQVATAISEVRPVETRFNILSSNLHTS